MENENDENKAAGNVPPANNGDGEVEKTAAESSHWYDGLDEDLKTNEAITRHKDAGSLARAYVDAQEKLSRSIPAPLGAGATAEQRAAYNSLRRGESIRAEGDYSWGKGTALENDETTVSLKRALFNAGADDYMASEVLSALKANVDAENAAEESYALGVYAKEAERLRMEWGENFSVNVKANDILLSRYPEAEALVKGLGLDKMAGFQQMLHSLNVAAADGQVVLGRAREATLDEQTEKISSSEAFRNSWHPEHKKAVLERARLIAEASRRQG